jgi:hypothetical protein
MGLRQFSTELVSRFETACSRLHVLMDEPSRPLISVEFARLPEAEQSRVLAMVEATAHCGEQMVREGASALDAGKLSWRVLSYMGLKPDSSAYTLFHPNDYIDVYNSSFKLIFASLNFLKNSAYPLDTLYSRPWTELWTRSSDDVLQAIAGGFGQVLQNPAGGTVALDLEPYIGTENISGRRAVIRCRGFSPVADSHGGYAVLCVNEIIRVLPTA